MVDMLRLQSCMTLLIVTWTSAMVAEEREIRRSMRRKGFHVRFSMVRRIIALCGLLKARFCDH